MNSFSVNHELNEQQLLAVESTAIGSVVNGKATAGDVLEINDVEVMFTTNTLGEVTVQNTKSNRDAN